MKLTTLAYIFNNQHVLMMHRIKKENDLNANKWIGVGGKVEADESAKQAILREIKEETGLTIHQLKLRGILTFILPKWENEICFLYEAATNQFTIQQCNEGVLEWIEKDKVLDLNLWQGDSYFLKPLLNSNDFIELKLIYDLNDQLMEVISE